VQGVPARGRPLTDLEVRHLSLLLEMRQRAHQYASLYGELLEDFVLALRDEGASARGIGDALGVPWSTIQTWTRNAQRRRDAG
jgi:hypothetical protein